MKTILVNRTTCPFALFNDACKGCSSHVSCDVSPRLFKLLSIGQMLQISINTLDL